MSNDLGLLMQKVSSSSLIGIAELPGSPAPRMPSGGTLTSLPFRASYPRVSPLPSKPPERFIAIGIDFGTTFSGVSWAYSEDPDLIHEVSHWPCAESQVKDEIQVPTQYDLATNQFGYLVSRDALPVKWFKLLLLEDKDVKDDLKGAEYLQDATKQLSERSMDVVELIADYLKKIWEHALTEIKTQVDIEVLPFRVAITIPAIWPQYAREKMKQAAQRAGILAFRPIGKTKLDLVEEPEAAALATLLERKKYPEIGAGEVFIVCDCGGGTVDIISYKVNSIEPFRLGEAAKGDGKLCGAFLIDDAFETWMQYKSGLKFDQCRSPKHDFRIFVNDEWEYTMKRAFSGSEATEVLTLRPPARAFSKVKRWRGANDSYSLKRETIRQFYNKTLNGIRQLISDQKKEIMRQYGKEPKKILLVGGLGSSRYIYNRLQAEHQNVLQPNRAWSVVARGAVIAVLRNTFSSKEFANSTDARVKQTLYRMPEISARVSRYNYGVEHGVPVHSASPPVDTSADKVTIDPDGTRIVWRMKWYLRQGDTVDNKDPVTCGFYQYIKDASTKKTTFKILTSNAAQAPVRKDHTVKQLCAIDCEFDIPWENMNVVAGVRRFDDLNLTMRYQGEPKWSLKVGKNTVEQDVNVQYMGSSI
ncbi:hypothetical protein BKA67DRAFT_634255 [Truncatella angustata]|uniref:Actin-like ATPase domain-containing protein n=1 Tax=Truncatella angustata TaxID=152316 RepID=A0A9P8UXY6_9PEZI|nr:uncharacterized protein BKA67DRAFT_634255 [Truncatella angustata]KAH6660387.1 hypothetical protein BKA67DRAFT_634255 [Truncatella angustata]